MLSECSMHFIENEILTKEMLQRIYDDSFVLIKTLLADIEWAVVSGLRIVNNPSGDARITPGLLVFNGKLLYHDGNFTIHRKLDVDHPDQLYRVFVKENDGKHSFQIEEDNEDECRNVFCRFLYDGDDIVKPPKKLEDFQVNRYLNVLDLPFCDLYGNYICNPLIAECLLKALEAKSYKSQQEMFLYLELLNKKNISILLLMNYIYGGHHDNKVLSRADLQKLCDKINDQSRQEPTNSLYKPSDESVNTPPKTGNVGTLTKRRK